MLKKNKKNGDTVQKKKKSQTVILWKNNFILENCSVKLFKKN